MIWITFNFYTTFWVAKSRLDDNLNDLVDTIVGSIVGVVTAGGFYFVYFRPFWSKDCHISRLEERILNEPPSCEDGDSEARIKLMDYRRSRDCRASQIKVKVSTEEK